MPAIGWLIVLAASVGAGIVFHERADRFLKRSPRAPNPRANPTPPPQAQTHAASAHANAPSAPSAIEVDAAKKRFADATEAVAILSMMMVPASDPRMASALAEQAASLANLNQMIEASGGHSPSPPGAPPGSPAPTPPPPPAPSGKRTYGPSNVAFPINESSPDITRWMDAVHAAMFAAHVPTEYAMAWLAIESGGKPCAIGEPGKVGPDGNPLELALWQAYNPDDLTPAGVTGKELRAYCVAGGQSLSRAMTPDEIARQMQLGVSLIGRKRRDAEHYMAAAGIAWPTTSPDYWAAVKLPHAYPPIINQGFLAVKKKLGRAPGSWAEFRATYEQIEPRAKYNPNAQKQTPYFRGLQNAEWVGFHVEPPAVS